MIRPTKIEFEFTVKRFADKNNQDDFGSMRRGDSNAVSPDWEQIEELEYKSLSAVQVLQKLIDYLETKS